ncbi:hypothetical protein M3T53_07540 [Actinomyces sp. B33]|uniref:hypothetical protein n=1 Tax=Actinomyces sp. B33 TaxID=2942131 RepID=UPI0023413F96|nr:hypothetical protein [Actinomyces sp. B33]MDC4233558.1 hypothetical protein [Actinomyces sp. B33]
MKSRTTRTASGAAALALASALALTACSTGADQQSAAPAPAPADAASTPTAGAGARFALAYDGGLKILDATTLDEVADIPLDGFNRINAAGDGEHLLISTEAGFRVLATGTDGSDAALSDHAITADKPGHVVVHGGSTVLFDDGTGSIQVFDTASFGDDAKPTRTIMSDAPHHGVAVELADGSVVRTIGTSEARTGALVEDKDGNEIARSEECPGVHGEGVAKGEVVTIGCENGVLVWDGQAFTKLTSPDADYGRIGNEYASEKSPIMVTDYKNDPDAEGVTLSHIGFVDTVAKTFEVIDMPEGVQYTWRGVRRDGDGGAWVLGTDGSLYRIDVDAKTIGDPIKVTGAWEGPEPWQAPHPALTIDGSTAWITEPATASVHRVDLATGQVTTAEVGVVPNEVGLATGK